MRDDAQPEWSRAALLTIDVQRDFALPGASAEIPGTHDVIPNIQRLVHRFREAQLPIIHVVRLYHSNGSNAELCRKDELQQGKQMVLTGSAGAELVEELKPSASVVLNSTQLLEGNLQPISRTEWIMYKPRWGAFYHTPLESHLQTIGANTVIIAGCNFPNCPRTTVYEASERDLRVVLISDATSGVYEQDLQELRNVGVTTLMTAVCLEQLSRAVSRR